MARPAEMEMPQGVRRPVERQTHTETGRGTHQQTQG